jgi:hypothetical protein
MPAAVLTLARHHRGITTSTIDDNNGRGGRREKPRRAGSPCKGLPFRACT